MASEITDHEAEQFIGYLREKKILGVADPRVVGAGGNLRDRIKQVMELLSLLAPFFLKTRTEAAGAVGAPKVGWETIKRILDVSPELFAKTMELVSLGASSELLVKAMELAELFRSAFESEPGLKGA